MHRKYSADLAFIISLSLLFLILFFGGGELAKLVKANYPHIIEEGPFSTLTLTNINPPTATFTLTAEPAYAATPTNTPTLTSTLIPTTILTPTNRPTFTSTPIDAPIQIPAFTSTFTPIATNTPTITPTPTNTSSFTPTPTDTPTETPIFTAVPTLTPTPTYALGLVLRQDRIRSKKTALILDNLNAGKFLDHNCLAFGEAFAYKGNIIYYKIDTGRLSDQKQTIATALNLNSENLTLDENDELKDKSFVFSFSSDLRSSSNVGYYPPGDFWIDPVPTGNLTYAILVTLWDSQKIIAGPVKFVFETTDINCGSSDSNGNDSTGPSQPSPTPAHTRVP